MKKNNNDIETATNELRDLVREAESLLAAKGGEAEEKAAHVSERVSEIVDSGREQLGKAKEVAKEKLTHCDDYVRTHPYHAVGIAAGVGALLGILASSNRRSA
jgi:ElaB/YqjD/DUF883 family membrane-anchored ribosome-binding protein